MAAKMCVFHCQTYSNTYNHSSKLGFCRKRSASAVVMSTSSADHFNLSSSSSSSSPSIITNKVFEDRMAGIVCYRDENGEITCEGYDEGPRLHQFANFGFHTNIINNRMSRNNEILEMCWLQVGDDTKGSH